MDQLLDQILTHVARSDDQKLYEIGFLMFQLPDVVKRACKRLNISSSEVREELLHRAVEEVIAAYPNVNEKVINKYLHLRLMDYYNDDLRQCGMTDAPMASTNRSRVKRERDYQKLHPGGRDPRENGLPVKGPEYIEREGYFEEETVEEFPPSTEAEELAAERTHKETNCQKVKAYENDPFYGVLPDERQPMLDAFNRLLLFNTDDQIDVAIIGYYKSKFDPTHPDCLLILKKITVREIAESTGFPKSTVQRRLDRMRNTPLRRPAVAI